MKTTADMTARILANPTAYGVYAFRSVESARAARALGCRLVLVRGAEVLATDSGRCASALKSAGFLYA